MRMLIKWLICFCALLIASACFPAHFRVFGGAFTLAAAAAVLWLVNLAVRPLLQIIALPVTLLTVGLFSFVVSAGMVKLTDILIPALSIRGFWVCLFTALLISAGNSLFAARRPNRS